MFSLTDDLVFLKVKFAPKPLTQNRSAEIRDIHNKWFEAARRLIEIFGNSCDRGRRCLLVRREGSFRSVRVGNRKKHSVAGQNRSSGRVPDNERGRTERAPTIPSARQDPVFFFGGSLSLRDSFSPPFRRFFAPHVRLLKYAARRNRAHDWHISFTLLILRSCYQAFPPPTYPVAYQSRVPRTRSIRASFDSPSFNFKLVEELR